MKNSGLLGGQLQVRSAGTGGLPSTYTVEPGRSLTGSWVIAGKYDLSVHGPNGFYRRFAGAAVKSGLHVRADLANHDRGKLVVTIDNPGRSSVEISIADAYRGGPDPDPVESSPLGQCADAGERRVVRPHAHHRR